MTSRHSHRAAGEILSGSEAVSVVRAPAVAPRLTPSVDGRRKRRPRGWGRKLSPRAVGKLITLRQSWSDPNGVRWQVQAVHRKDGLARLECHRYVTFEALGTGYRLDE